MALELIEGEGQGPDPHDMSRVEIQRLVEKRLDDMDTDELRTWVAQYLESGVHGASIIGRGYAVDDANQREDFADWVVNLMARVTAYRQVMEGRDE